MLASTKDLIGSNYKFEHSSIPLRIWTKDWPLPQKIKFDKYSINVATSKKTNVVLNRHALWGKIEKAEDFFQRVYKQKKPKQWGKGTKKSGRRFDYKKKGNYIWIKILSKSNVFGLEDRRFHFDGRYLRMSLNFNEIGIWYISGDGQIRFIILPKQLELNEDLFELLGFLEGEMCKKKNNKGGSSVKISNSEPIIITQIVKRFHKIFKIPIGSWSASLTLNNKDSKFYGKDKVLKKFWSEKSKIPLENFTKTTTQSKYRSLFSDKGIIQIRYSDTLFFNVLLEIMNNIREIASGNKKDARSYIRGIAAGEGGIGKRGEKLRIVHIGSMDEENKIFYSKLLMMIGITSIQRYDLRIEICGLENFKLLREMDVFKYIPYRKKKFLDALNTLEKNYKKRATQPLQL